ncbi:hypothetical protein SARC_04755 [Sphaeroforma arctica JP610]|uniref:Calcineurin-like phosphoesterase domain-containing protein n=1 Tax=Sphaeroforma arctica JP610 TaxID=667725 RepID=A0A0L0G1D1_9EUKA|nr:hypothetical protein SARC_04755 [Sphaeroforma arctica JP610]KNC82962.1 hypothetical protein SARC_04755 [Sphaeroforma arctica JP610]|eukprot:XP_014156864.1 hypothetical protein SARC_04755 [Sphaeroforma arctica JP610]
MRLCKPVTLIIVLTCALLAYCEYIVFHWAAHQWRYDPLPCQAKGTCVRIAAIADPQLQGYQDEPSGVIGSITRYDADHYLRSAYGCLVQYMSPDVVVILGDVLDEGYQADDESYVEYLDRFNSIFSPDMVSRIIVPGDNDIGGEGRDTQDYKQVHRFEDWQGAVNQKSSLKGIEFVSINILALTAQQKTVESIKSTTQFVHDYTPVETFSVLLSHAPTTMLPKDKQRWLVENIQPNLILSGHTHISGQQVSRGHSGSDLLEWTAPTFSYRMGVSKIGFLSILVDPITHQVSMHECWLPSRYNHLAMYGVWAAALIFIGESVWLFNFWSSWVCQEEATDSAKLKRWS